MDFIRVAYKENNDGTREFYPSLQALESQDLVIRGGQFVALWDEDTNLYNRKLSHLPRIIDKSFQRMVGDTIRDGDVIKKVINFNNQIYNKIMSLIRQIGDMGPELDQHLVFADQEPTKEDAATFKMPYSLSDAAMPAWEEIVSTLYDEEERLKIEWAIGSILTGAAAENIQKFYVFFGPPGSGKSTIMNIINLIFQGHTAAFSAHEMGKADAQFSLEPFKHNPLVGIDQDGDLSRIEMNTNLNKITAHDKVLINAKGKSLYEIIPRTTLFIGSNEPVKIRDRKSGLFRRLIDIQPSSRLIDEEPYHILMEQVRFELGSIAAHCIRVFLEHGPTYFSGYRSNEMMYRTNDIFNFVEDNRLILSQGVSLKQAHKLYTEWCEQTDTRNIYKQYQFRDLMRDYFKEFHAEIMIDGVRHRSFFSELRELDKFSWKGLQPAPPKDWLTFDSDISILDEYLKDMPAQEASSKGTPKRAWSEVKTTLSDIDTSVEHFVQVPEQLVVIDIDLKDKHGKKSLEACLEEAAKWPPTYAEPSKSGEGIHLHYEFDGDVSRLRPVYSDGIEVKTLLGNASLRRRFRGGNNLAITKINSGLPLKEEKVLAPKTMQTEKGLRELVLKGLRKEVHAYTKPSMDFIKMVTDEAYNNGVVFDISDMWDDIMSFAMSSSNQRSICIETAMSIKLKSEEDVPAGPDEDKPEVIFDVEVFPNLNALGWMYDRDDAEVVTVVNPSPAEVEELIARTRLEGWNNRGYDNHILWAISLGWPPERVYDLSRRIIAENDRRALFGSAYNLAYADLYDCASNANKKSLKKWEIDLGLPHMELDLPWDQPVPDDRVLEVLEYLENDVRSTRVVKHHIIEDLKARQILAELSGLEVCNTNRQHTERLIFGKLGPNDQPDLVYTDLREQFPGYEFDQFAPGKEKSTYKGYKVSEGGWVKSKPGMYENVAVLDIASMHPTSIVELNMFGKDTKNFKRLLDIRLAIKKGDYDTAIDLDERLAPYLTDKASAKALSDALKIVINSVYGLTASTFPHKFRDPNNIDNIVAKRGALFMVDLVEFVEERGFEVVHVKTDSIKIPGATPDIIRDVEKFGEKYGYSFEHEATYERFCLVNDAVYVARTDGVWSATGAQYLHPVVFKTLFTHEELEPKDYVEVKQVAKGNMYLRSEESGVDTFLGRFAAVVPVLGGRLLIRIDGSKESAVTGTKGHLWETDKIAFEQEMDVDYSYFQNLIDAGRKTIEKFGDFAGFTSS